MKPEDLLTSSVLQECIERQMTRFQIAEKFGVDVITVEAQLQKAGILDRPRGKRKSSNVKDTTHYYVYALYSASLGVFYIGSGKSTRLHKTINEAHLKHLHTRKHQIIRECEARGEEVEMAILYDTLDQMEALHVEQDIILAYGSCLANFMGLHTASYLISGEFNTGKKKRTKRNKLKTRQPLLFDEFVEGGDVA